MVGARGPFKPKHIGGYSDAHSEACERTLVTLMRFLGPWKRSVYVIGGLVPRFLIPADAATGLTFVPTMDVDLVLALHLLANTEAYARFETNLKRLAFKRALSDEGKVQHFRWTKRLEGSMSVIVDLLCDADAAAGKAVSIDKGLSALGIPGAHLAIRDFVERELTAELLDDGGMATEIVRIANIVPFIVLKALAYDDRNEQKDAHDLVYCLRHHPGGPDAVAAVFTRRMRDWPDEPLLAKAVAILRRCFGSDDAGEGHRKHGCVSYAQFLTIQGRHEQDLVHQRDAAGAVARFLALIGSS